jgi:selT/selW/selH-like putative selenoprotein
MGGQESSVPEEVQALPKNNKKFNLSVEYCGAWGGLPEANYASKVIKTAFPNANIDQYTPGKTGNLVIKLEGQTVFDKKGGDGSFNGKKAT